MFLQHAEFAGGEFAAVEFAFEPNLQEIIDTDFASVGASSFQFYTNVQANAVVNAAGSSTFALTGAGVNNTDLAAEAVSVVGFDGWSTADSVLSSAGTSGSSLRAQQIELSSFALTGQADGEFKVAADPGFDIRGMSSMTMVSAATANVVVSAPGDGAASFVGQARANTTMSASGQGLVDWRAIAKANTTLMSAGAATPSLTAQGVVNTTAQSISIGQFTPIANYTAQTKFAAAGTASSSLVAQRVLHVYAWLSASGYSSFNALSNARFNANTRFTSAGASQVQLHGQRVLGTVVQAQGYSQVTWNRGKQVLPLMDLAFDVVEHPEEIVAVERPEENRTADWS